MKWNDHIISFQYSIRTCERKISDKMSSTQRFSRKLWDLVNSCTSGSLQWNKSGDVIVFDFTLFKKEFLDHSDKFCKSNKIASFVRQLNLYGFKKVSNSRRSRKRDAHEFKHPWFARDREDWLQNVTRNSVFSTIGKKGTMRRRRRSMQKKSHQKNRVNNAAPKAGRRGRPRKSEQINKKFDESDHSYEKRSQNGNWGRKELEARPMSPLRATPSPRKNEWENPFKCRTIDPYSKSKAAELKNITNTLFSNANSAVDVKAEERRLEDCKLKCNEFMPWQNRNEAFSKYHASHNQEQPALPIYGFQNQENIAPTPKAFVPTTQPSPQWGWNGTKPELCTQMHGDGTVPPNVFNMNKTLEHLPLAPAHPKTTTWAMQATLDENQHVMLRIDDSYANHTATLDKGNNYKTKLTIQNGHISKQLLPTGRVETLQPCARNISFTNAAASNITEYPRVNQNYQVAQEIKAYEPYFSYETNCYVTQEFLDIREAYFRHYPERRPTFDGPDLRIYR